MGKKITPLMTKGMLTAKLESNDDVLLWLKKTPEAFKRKLLISLLRNAAKPMMEQAKSNVSSMATRSKVANTNDLRDFVIESGWDPTKVECIPNFVNRNNQTIKKKVTP